jgi:small neutral amino acid transporter SnatA (MarC family)
MIPSIMNIKIRSGRGFKFRLWLPLFLVWPILLVLFLLLLPFLIIAEIVLRLTGVDIYLFRLLGGLLSVVMAMRGLTVKVNSIRQNSIVHVTIL